MQGAALRSAGRLCLTFLLWSCLSSVPLFTQTALVAGAVMSTMETALFSAGAAPESSWGPLALAVAWVMFINSPGDPVPVSTLCSVPGGSQSCCGDKQLTTQGSIIDF